MLIHCWWEYEMVQLLGKQFFRKLNIELFCDPAFLLLDTYPREMKTSVQFSGSVVSYSLWHHGLQHTRHPCPSPTPGACSNSCPSSWWCHPAILLSVVPLSSCLQSFPASGSFPVSQFFALGGQSIGASASASVLPMNIQGWPSLGLTGLISVLVLGSLKLSNTTVWNH